jgi:primosomal protein N' (replication factor Y)
MRVELKQGNTAIFSRALRKELGEVLAVGQQAILLLNRRGSASYVFCRDCGHSLRCPRCDFPLTYHRASAGLVCHTCGYTRKMPQKCPNCGSSKIKQFGLGTEKVETELQRAFPSARLLRWDADTAKGKDSQEIILSHFRQHNADILIGTQMLAKGLDLPLVTLVGVVLADVGLNFPDYRTAERAFQLLTQVAGRAGRSALGGRVLVQTFQPEHYAIRFAAQHDFAGFYAYELEQRRRLSYPPFVRMLRIEARERDNDTAREKAQGLAGRLRALIQRGGDRTLSLTGPLPPYFARQNGQYRWQLILKGAHPESLLHDQDLSGFIVEVDPPSLL